MKKLFTTLICATVFMPCIFSMNELEPISELYPYELTKKILLELAQNVHKYTYKEWNKDKAELTSHIIFNVSLVNKELYTELDKQRNDPITARIIITHLARHRFTDFDVYIAENFSFPGAKKCLTLSDQLYNDDLNEDMVEELFKNGAILNYTNKQQKQYPLSYWSLMFHHNSDTSKAIVKKLLNLGADPNPCGILDYVITTNNIDIIKMVLNYKPVISKRAWWAAVSNSNPQQYIDLLVSYATPDELNTGLVTCFKHPSQKIIYKPEMIQKFIDNGANLNTALPLLMGTLTHIPCPLNADNFFVKNFEFLCDQKAFDKTALNTMRSLANLFVSLADKLEENQPFQDEEQ